MFDDNITDTKRTEGAGFSKAKDNPNTPSAEQIMKAHQTVYLFKWLFPETVIESHLKKISARGDLPLSKPFSKFKTAFTGKVKSDYWSKFDNIDTQIVDESDSDIDYKDSEDEEMYDEDDSFVQEPV